MTKHNIMLILLQLYIFKIAQIKVHKNKINHIYKLVLSQVFFFTFDFNLPGLKINA